MKPPPHIIVIMADQLRHDFICPEFTPHLCALMAESACFTRAYTAAPLCVPARGAFFTGRYPNETGCLINGWEPSDRMHGRVKAGVPNLYATFSGAGYDSWHAGKQHFHPVDEVDERTHWLTLEEGYDRHLKVRGARAPGGPAFTGITPELHGRRTTAARRYSIPRTGCYPGTLDDFFDGYILSQALRAIESRDPTRPLLLNAMFVAPHPPLEIPAPWFEKFSDVKLADNVGVWDRLQSPLNLYHLSGAIGARYQRQEWVEPWRVYAGVVNLLDECVGRLIDKLRAEGLYEDAIVVFTSDHGEMLGSHCLWQKMVLYEESARVPLSIRLPGGNRGGRVVADPVSLLDVFPTLCDLTAVPAPAGASGISLRRLIEGSSTPVDRPVFIQSDGNGALEKWSRGVVCGDWKLIVDGFKDELFFELYQLDRDPGERDNLAFTADSECRGFLKLLCDHMVRTGDAVSLAESDYDFFLKAYAYQAGGAS